MGRCDRAICGDVPTNRLVFEGHSKDTTLSSKPTLIWSGSGLGTALLLTLGMMPILYVCKLGWAADRTEIATPREATE